MNKFFFRLIILFCLITEISSAQYKKLHDFILNNTDGWGPSCTMVINGNKLFGMTNGGGKDSIGTIFSIDTNGSGEQLLYSFNGTDGAQPVYSSLTLIENKLYGIAGGGTSNDGVIFSIDTNGKGYKVLFNFNGSNGNAPEGKLVLSGNKLYGTTYYGGTNNDGVIFSIDTNGAGYKVLFNFNNSITGEYPYGCGLTLSGNTFYGTTSNGGKYSSGTIFSIDTSGSIFNTIYNFLDTGAMAASGATGQLALSGTTLFGMTTFGGGTGGSGALFAIQTNGGGYHFLHDFSTYCNGENPYNSLALSGKILYGMSQGGTNGNIFSVDTDGTNYSCLYSFSGTDGSHSVYCGLTLWGGMIYGVTNEGGIDNEGVIFSYKDSAITTSVSELNTGSETVKVWPNPSNGIFNLQSGIRNLTGKIVIYNSLGQQVYSTPLNLPQGGDFKVDVHTQPTGMYLYRVTSEKGELIGSGKLVVEK